MLWNIIDLRTSLNQTSTILQQRPLWHICPVEPQNYFCTSNEQPKQFKGIDPPAHKPSKSHLNRSAFADLTFVSYLVIIGYSLAVKAPGNGRIYVLQFDVKCTEFPVHYGVCRMMHRNGRLQITNSSFSVAFTWPNTVVQHAKFRHSICACYVLHVLLTVCSNAKILQPSSDPKTKSSLDSFLAALCCKPVTWMTAFSWWLWADICL